MLAGLTPSCDEFVLLGDCQVFDGDVMVHGSE
jgi:hypothetical protein